MTSLILLLLCADAAVPLTSIPVPLGHIGDVVESVPPGGLPPNSQILFVESCEPQAIFYERYISGTIRALEQLQFWLDANKGLEKKLFTKKNTLGEVMGLARSASFSQVVPCLPSVLDEGFKWSLLNTPKKFCQGLPERREYWGFNKKNASFTVSFQNGQPNTCALRFSSILFDKSGVARVRLHADWGGKVSAELLGDRCQKIDFSLDETASFFVPSRSACKP
jgi:hypothetical protein